MKKTVAANTFTPLYDELEDRIRLVVNYQDIQNRVDFMITRSFILNLIPTAEEFIQKHYSDVAFVQDSVTPLKNIDTKTEETLSGTDGVNLELLRTSEELLIEVNFSFDSNTKQTVVTLSSKNRVAKAILDSSSLSQTFELIKASIPYIRWGISQYF